MCNKCLIICFRYNLWFLPAWKPTLRNSFNNIASLPTFKSTDRLLHWLHVNWPTLVWYLLTDTKLMSTDPTQNWHQLQNWCKLLMSVYFDYFLMLRNCSQRGRKPSKHFSRLVSGCFFSWQVTPLHSGFSNLILRKGKLVSIWLANTESFGV